jgi:hypothetical protein
LKYAANTTNALYDRITGSFCCFPEKQRWKRFWLRSFEDSLLGITIVNPQKRKVLEFAQGTTLAYDNTLSSGSFRAQVAKNPNNPAVKRHIRNIDL